jgi:hypothetical protein
VANDTIFTGGNIRKLADNQCIFFRNAAGNVEATIGGTGNVGIGTCTPTSQLHIIGNSAGIFTDGLRIGRNGNTTQYTILNHAGGATNLSSVDASGNNIPEIYFNRSSDGTSMTSSMMINKDGNVGIGTSTPRAKLHISINERSTPRGSGFTKLFLTSCDADTNYYEFQTPSTAASDFLFSSLNTGDYGIIGYSMCTHAFRVYTKSSPRFGINCDGIATFCCQVCSAGTFISNVGASTSTYGFTHCGSNGYYGRFGVPNASYMYLETNANSGVYIDSTTRTNYLSVNAGWSNSGGANQPLQVKSGTGGSGIWVESCSSDAGGYINMVGNCMAIGQSYRSSAGYNDILFQTAGTTRMIVRCAGNVEVQTGIVSPMFMIERNSAYDDITTGCYLSLNDAGTVGLLAKFHQQFSPYVNSGEAMTWNYVRVLVRITSNSGTFSQSLAGCIRNATYAYTVGWRCFGDHIQVGSTMDSGRGFKWVVMPWFGYSDLYSATDVPGFGLYNQFSDIPLRIGAVYLQYKT